MADDTSEDLYAYDSTEDTDSESGLYQSTTRRLLVNLGSIMLAAAAGWMLAWATELLLEKLAGRD